MYIIFSLSQLFFIARTDGEVESFKLVPVEDVAKIIRSTQYYKDNCNIVIIDFMIRHGYDFVLILINPFVS